VEVVTRPAAPEGDPFSPSPSRAPPRSPA
jgi:hypothetical protein